MDTKTVVSKTPKSKPKSAETLTAAQTRRIMLRIGERTVEMQRRWAAR